MSDLLMFLLIGLILFGILVFFAFLKASDQQTRLTQFKQELVEKFGKGEYYADFPGPRCFGLSWERKLIIVGVSQQNIKAFDFAAIRSCGIEVDNVTVTTSQSSTKANRGSQVAGAALGSLVLGPAGLLVGGLSGGSTTTGKSIAHQNVKSVKLLIRLNDNQMPIVEYPLFWAGGEGKSIDLVSVYLQQASRLQALLLNIIEGNASEPPTEAVVATKSNRFFAR